MEILVFDGNSFSVTILIKFFSGTANENKTKEKERKNDNITWNINYIKIRLETVNICLNRSVTVSVNSFIQQFYVLIINEFMLPSIEFHNFENHAHLHRVCQIQIDGLTRWQSADCHNLSQSQK